MALFKREKLQQLQEMQSKSADLPLILLVDDEDANLRVMRQILEQDYQLICHNSAAQALQWLQNQVDLRNLAVIISDQRMPGMSGVDFLQQSIALAPDANRIIVTGFSDIGAIIDSINRAEIYRYIVKPFDTQDFQMTVKRTVETWQMRCQLKRFQQELEEKVALRTAELAQKNLELERTNRALQEASLTDPLTGLRNRRFLLQQMDADAAIILRRHEECIKLQQTPPADADLVFFMVDLDHFKQVNDVYGHAAGDSVLVQMRERLQQVFRESDYLVRWGGEEFLVVARATRRSDAAQLAERMCETIANQDFHLQDGLRIRKTCSVGFACLPFLLRHPQHFTWAQVADLADQALYMAKRRGRNTWVGLYEDRVRPEPDLFQRLQGDIEHAIASGLLQSVQRQTTPAQEEGEMQ
ncbi:diguanylate cyclase [Massilia sp. W12]|uniref:diguanylate cyclase n=1 Tax=Massilia sp. W12 TaxID=3126507 RepID=UPI0030D12134